MAPFTHHEGFTRFYPQHGDEKQVQIVINPHRISLIKSAVGAPFWILVDFFYFRANSANEKEHGTR